MRILIKNTQKDLRISSSSIRRLACFVLEKIYRVQCTQVSIHLVDVKTITKMHQDYFNDPTETDCISFPIDAPFSEEPCEILGDIFVCPFVAKKYAKAHKKDPYQETALYIIHGLLHLLGYDDIHEKDRKEMRKQEKRCISHLNRADITLSKVKEVPT